MMRHMIQQISRDAMSWIVVVALVVFAVGTSMGSFYVRPAMMGEWEWVSNWLQNLGTETLGAVLAFLAVNQLVGGRAERRRIVRDMSHSHNPTALRAVKEATENGMLADGTFEGAEMRRADLSRAELIGARLAHADLRQAELRRVNLKEADLAEAKLRGARLTRGELRDTDLRRAQMQSAQMDGASLWGTNLTEANLMEVNLTGASLFYVNLTRANLTRTNLRDTVWFHSNLEGADLCRADLRGADLREANLVGVNLEEVTFDENTLLPDAGKSEQNHDYTIGKRHWQKGTDMSRYTDPKHPGFWQPRWAKQ